MRVAVLIEDADYRALDPLVRRLFLFDMRDEIITGAGERNVNLRYFNSFVLWLLSKAVKSVYADDLPEQLMKLLSKAEISLHPLDSIKEFPYLHAFIMRGTGSK